MVTDGNHEPTSIETDRAAHYHERRFRALVEHSMDIIALVNTEGLVTYISPSITPIMGYSPEDFIGSSALVLVHPGDLDHMQRVLGAIMQGGDQPVRAEYRLRCADGTYRWFEATATNWLEDPEVGAIIGHFHDITERKRAEERVQFLSEASKLLASSLDYQTTLSTVARLVVPRLADWCTIDLVDRQGQIQLLNIVHIDPDKVRWAKQLRELNPIDPQAPTGVPHVIRTGRSELIADIPDAPPAAVAKNEEELPLLRLVGYRSLMVVPLVAAGRTIGAITFVSAGAGRRFSASDLSLAEEVGLRAGMAIEHARLYQEVQQAHDQLTLEERRKDAFLAMVSHELKTPVTSLKGFTQVLSLFLADHPEAQIRLFLERMDAQLNNLTRLINDLLTLSHMQAGDLAMREEIFDLDMLIRETIEQVQATTTTHHLQLQGTTSVKLTGDRDRLAQVLINLLMNAIRYSPQANRVLVRVRADQRQAEIAVQDFGIGIDQAHHEQIFEHFYQVPDQVERTLPGMGIGLYLARTITERHGGRISVESRKGKGSTFRVELPLVKGEQIAMPDHTLREKREVEQ
jgi:PAS domain S-box-containing protein